MKFKDRVNELNNTVTKVEIALSRKHKDHDEIFSANDKLIDIFNDIKYEFITGDVVIGADGKKYPTWDGDAFDEALNKQYPGLSFRLNSAMTAIEELIEAIEKGIE